MQFRFSLCDRLDLAGNHHRRTRHRTGFRETVRLIQSEKDGQTVYRDVETWLASQGIQSAQGQELPARLVHRWVCLRYSAHCVLPVVLVLLEYVISAMFPINQINQSLNRVLTESCCYDITRVKLVKKGRCKSRTCVSRHKAPSGAIVLRSTVKATVPDLPRWPWSTSSTVHCTGCTGPSPVQYNKTFKLSGLIDPYLNGRISQGGYKIVLSLPSKQGFQYRSLSRS
jgi:hypothetical protein